MKKNIAIGLIALSVVSFTIISSCKKEENETKISSHNSDESHNAGQNCMNCHRSGGEGEGNFTVAGTIYDSTGTSVNPNGTVKIYSHPNGNGNVLATIEVDAKGNFYTTESIDLSSGTYPSITGASGSTRDMPDITTSGACNSCHGVSQARIWIN